MINNLPPGYEKIMESLNKGIIPNPFDNEQFKSAPIELKRLIVDSIEKYVAETKKEMEKQS